MKKAYTSLAIAAVALCLAVGNPTKAHALWHITCSGGGLGNLDADMTLAGALAVTAAYNAAGGSCTRSNCGLTVVSDNPGSAEINAAKGLIKDGGTCGNSNIVNAVAPVKK